MGSLQHPRAYPDSQIHPRYARATPAPIGTPANIQNKQSGRSRSPQHQTHATANATHRIMQSSGLAYPQCQQSCTTAQGFASGRIRHAQQRMTSIHIAPEMATGKSGVGWSSKCARNEGLRGAAATSAPAFAPPALMARTIVLHSAVESALLHCTMERFCSPR